jgi:hypothetical protein
MGLDGIVIMLASIADASIDYEMLHRVTEISSCPLPMVSFPRSRLAVVEVRLKISTALSQLPDSLGAKL